MSLLPQPYALLAKGAAVVAVIGGLWWSNQHYVVNPAVDRANSAWQQKWDKRDKQDAASVLQQEKDNREKELALQADADAAQAQADKDKAELASRLAASRASAERLQSGIANAISALDKGSAVTGAPGSRTAGNPAGVLLADLYRSINERAGQLAEEADRRRDRGLVCEALWVKARSSAQEKTR